MGRIKPWHEGHRLGLIQGPYDADKELTNLIHRILVDEFELTGTKLFETHPEPEDEERFHPSQERSFVIGAFKNGEVRVEVGEVTLSHLDGKSLFYVVHPYHHASGVDVETVLKQARITGDVIKSNLGQGDGEDQHLKLTYVAPVGAYDQNHSVERNRQQKRIIEGRGLLTHMQDLARAGFDQVISIQSHNSKSIDIARDTGMKFREIDPFQRRSFSNLRQYLYERSGGRRADYDVRMARLAPLVQLVRQEEPNTDDLYFISTDDGSEEIAIPFAEAVREDDGNTLAAYKGRVGPEQSSPLGSSTASVASLDDVKGKTGVLVDDRRLSGNTLNDLAGLLKVNGAKRVVAVIAHDISYDLNIMQQGNIDRFYFLETNPDSAIAQMQQEDSTLQEKVVRLGLDTTARLLAVEIYDSYVKHRDSGGKKV